MYALLYAKSFVELSHMFLADALVPSVSYVLSIKQHVVFLGVVILLHVYLAVPSVKT